MKNCIVFLFLTIIIASCEKDDFCTQNPVTPNLVVRFYDNTAKKTTKKVERLSVWATGKDTLSAYQSVSTDSIAIPLNSLDSKTVYHLKMNTTNGATKDNKITTFTINYTPKEDFVSRACGFRIIFNEVKFTSNDGWFQSFTPADVTTINSQNKAHVQVFH